jgi:hypothetical protein
MVVFFKSVQSRVNRDNGAKNSFLTRIVRAAGPMAAILHSRDETTSRRRKPFCRKHSGDHSGHWCRRRRPGVGDYDDTDTEPPAHAASGLTKLLADRAVIGCEGSRGLGTVYALVLMALVVAIAQAVVGVRLVGGGASHDGAFAVGALTYFSTAGGWLLPRWSSAGNAGLGTPLFFFYPPGAYAIAFEIGKLMPGLPAATVLGLIGILFRASAIVTSALWLRRHVSTAAAALSGGALFALMPYISLVNPQLRMAFAEMAATVILPLAFLAIDLGHGQLTRTVMGLAPVIAALTLTHVPTAVIASGLIVVYSAFLGQGCRGAGYRSIGAISGVILGLILAAVTLVPAVCLLPEISTSMLDFPRLLPTNNFLLTRNVFIYTYSRAFGALLNINLLASVAAAVLSVRATWRTGSNPLAIVGTFVTAVLFTLPIAAPLWAIPLTSRLIQFPWRLLMPISLLGTALLITSLPRMGHSVRRGAFWCAMGIGIFSVGFAILRGDHWRPGLVRTQEALASGSSNAPEYFPATAALEWLAYREAGTIAIRQRADALSQCRQHRTFAISQEPDGLLVDVAGCEGKVLVPQFYFPGWSVAWGTSAAPVADPASGLTLLDMPAGVQQVLLRRSTLPAESLGILVSCIGLLIWTTVSIYAITTPNVARRKRPE